MLRTGIKVVLAAVLVFAAYVALQPSAFVVARSVQIAATPQAVFTHVDDFKKWQAWSPWAKLDPAAKVNFGGQPTGKGAMFGWSGNDQVGEGQMAITESRPAEHIAIKLDFIRPWPDTADVAFDFKPAATGTEVTWSMRGERGFVEKAFCLVMNMEAMIGSDYEKGLANLKSIVEAGTPQGS